MLTVFQIGRRNGLYGLQRVAQGRGGDNVHRRVGQTHAEAGRIRCLQECSRIPIQQTFSTIFLTISSNFRTGYGLAFQPDSMFAETFNQGIMEAAMTGHVDFWLKKALFEKKVAVTEAK